MRLEEKAEVEQVLLVYPDGYQHYWNECRKAATSTANIENINENPFFEEMINYFANKYHYQQEKSICCRYVRRWPHGTQACFNDA